METFSSLLLKAQNMCVDDGTQTFTGLSPTSTFLTIEINNTIRDIFYLLKKYNLRPLPKTALTVKNQIYYHYPPGISKPETVTCTAGSLVIPLKIIHSQEEWDRLHQIPISSGFPVAFFPRRDDFGIFPTPQSNGAVITLNGNYTPVNLTTPDYPCTVTATFGSSLLTGTGFTAAMVGQWFSLTDSNGIPDGNWYRISSFGSSSNLILETPFQQVTTSGPGIIGQSPDCPEELQEFIPYRAAAAYYQHRHRDPVQAQQLLNFYYTGDYTNQNRRGNIRGGVLAILGDLQENGRGNSQLVTMGEGQYSPQIMGGIWSTIIT